MAFLKVSAPTHTIVARTAEVRHEKQGAGASIAVRNGVRYSAILKIGALLGYESTFHTIHVASAPTCRHSRQRPYPPVVRLALRIARLALRRWL